MASQTAAILVEGEQNTQATERIEVSHSSRSVSDMAQAIDEIKQLYSKEKTVKAYEILQELRELLKNAEQDQSEDEAVLSAKELLENEKTMLDQIETEAKSVHALIAELDSEEGWSLQKDEDGIKTWFKQPEGSPTYQIKMRGLIKSPIMNVLALIKEVDLYQKWIPTCTKSRLDLEITTFKQMIQLQFCPPSPVWVVSPRELMLYGYGVDMMEESNVLIAMAKSAGTSELDYLKKQFDYNMDGEGKGRSSGTIRMTCHLAGLIMEPVDKDTTRMSLLSNTDPKVQLPYSLINIVTKKFAHLIFVFLRNHASKLDEEYQQRIEQGGEIYDNIRARIKSI